MKMSSKRTAGWLVLTVVAAILVGCAAPAPAPITVEKIVQQTVVVEKQATVIVEKEVPATVVVEKEVPATVVVEKEVPVDKKTVILSYNRFFNMSFGDGPSPLEAIRQAVAAKYPEIDVQINLAPDNMSQWHDAMAIWITAKDNTIDLFGMDTPWVSEFGAAEWAVPLNEHFPDIADKFEQAGLDLFSYDGKLLAIPFWTATSGLYYRTDLLEEAGYEPPKTWDELTEIVEAIQKENPDLTGYLWAGAKEESLTMVWSEFLHAFGGKYWEDDGACAFNSPEGVKAVEYMKSTIDSGLSPKETTAWNNDEARTRFVEGKAIFLRGPHDYITWLNDPAKSSVVDKWAFMPNPAGEGGIQAGSSGGFGLAIQPYTDDLEAALKVMDVVTSEEVQKAFAIAWGPVQYYKDLYEIPEVKNAYPEAYRLGPVLETSLARPQHPNYAQVSTIIQDEVHAALTGVKPVQQALDDACSQIDALK
jgi:multiple sugar transport system substrate-binding protein